MSRGRAVPSLAAAVIIALTASLGNWQIRRAAEKLQLQEQGEAAEQTQPVPLGPVLVSQAQVEALVSRRASVRGRFLAGRSVYLDNRTYNGVPGFYVATPLRIEGGAAGAAASEGDAGAAASEGGAGARVIHVLVLRGWVAGDPRRRTMVPVVPTPAESLEVTGLVERELPQALELQHSGPPGPQQRIWQNLTRHAFASWSGLTLQPLLLRQTEPALGIAGPLDDGLIRDWPRPGLDAGKHRGYAFQWYALALTTALLWLWFVVVQPIWLRRTAANGGK